MRWLFRLWYGPRYGLTYLLFPFSLIYLLIINIRLFLFKIKIKKSVRLSVPVIIVGNITVGGAGKTPLVAYIATLLKKRGYQPGIVSRGYKGRNKFPSFVFKESNPYWVGDEAVMLARQTECPIVVAPNRIKAAHELLSTYPCDIIISDDGLQHYALARNIEIAVIDRERQLGNQLCLPAGPLREPKTRLKKVDKVITLQYQLKNIYSILNPQKIVDINFFKDKKVHAIAAIGNPDRFFNDLRALGLTIIPHYFRDHYFFKREDFNFNDSYHLIMTEKDAIKCETFADERFFCLAINPIIPLNFDSDLFNFLKVNTNAFSIK